MDSFFDQPRTAPEPIPIEKFAFSPIVPEVSMICNAKTSHNNFSSENVWKMKCQQMERPDSHNCPPVGYRQFQAQFSKKQVRFESPVLQQKPCSSQTPSKKIDPLGTDSCKKNLNVNHSNNPKSFEQIYMANIPDRKLDLSLLDLPNTAKYTDNLIHTGGDELLDNSEKLGLEKSCESKDNDVKEDSEDKENCMPKTYQDFLELQKKMIMRRRHDHNDSVTDIFNYKRNNPTMAQDAPSRQPLYAPLVENNVLSNSQHKTNNFLQENRFLPHNFRNYQHFEPVCTNFVKQKCDTETQTHPEEFPDSKALQNRKECEPTNSDLLKIISQQNEQLLLLQRQVALLLERDKNPKQAIENSSDSEKNNDEQSFTSSSTPHKNPHFRQENTITKQASIFQDNQRKWGMSKFSINLTTSFEMPLRTQQKQNFVNHEPKIQEITESDFSPKKDNLEASLHLQEPLDVRESCPSPQPSININMNDYESSDDEELVSEIGATFYNNLMGQVNNMLQKAKIESQGSSQDDDKRTKTLNKVKDATLKHLKSIGITLGNIEENAVPGGNYSPSEISCTVKQLLMKYLPQDQVKMPEKPNLEPATGIISPRPEFSIASLEYMRKYNLIPSKEKIPDFIQPQIVRDDWNRDNKRILDLTALKMQPKLL